MAKGSVCLSVCLSEPPRLCPCLDVNLYVYGLCVCLTKKICLYFCAFDCGNVAISKKTLCVYVCVCWQLCASVVLCDWECVVGVWGGECYLNKKERKWIRVVSILIVKQISTKHFEKVNDLRIITLYYPASQGGSWRSPDGYKNGI